MRFNATTKITTAMIYLGTFFLSVLSFFTTLYGMLIMVPWPLAIIGASGIQIAILGIAWNLIRIHEGRWKYVLVFCVASSFSIFFSYANFDMNIKSNVRPNDVRNAYYEPAKSTLAEYSNQGKKAVLAGRYQVDRVANLIKLEEEKGWATVSDEGSQDKFVQSIIDGARRTVESWKNSQGSDYRQGKGRGIITSYLESRMALARENYASLTRYNETVDSLGYLLKSNLPVERQFDIVNKAYVNFPSGEIASVYFDNNPISLSKPPSLAAYAEQAESRQQALMMVINDLYAMDGLTFVALVLAISVDIIVMLMALAGGYAVQNMDYLMERLEEDTASRLKTVTLDDPKQFGDTLDSNLARYRKATQYSLDIVKVMAEYKAAREGLKNALRKKAKQLKNSPPILEPLEASKQVAQTVAAEQTAPAYSVAQAIMPADLKKNIDKGLPFKNILKTISSTTIHLAEKASQLFKRIIQTSTSKAAKPNSRLALKKKSVVTMKNSINSTRPVAAKRFQSGFIMSNATRNLAPKRRIVGLIETIKSKKNALVGWGKK
jgi:hypothetical protein